MKNLIRLFSTFLTLVVVVGSMIMPTAHSLLADWEITTNDVFFESMINVNVKVLETLELGTKKDVKIQNIGQSPCYIKAMVVITPINADDDSITSRDFTIAQNENDETKDIRIDWSSNTSNGSWLPVNSPIKEINDNSNTWLFIWDSPVAPGDITDNLIDTLTIQNPTDRFKVEIIAEGIYTNEVSNWVTAYSINVSEDDGLLSLNATS